MEGLEINSTLKLDDFAIMQKCVHVIMQFGELDCDALIAFIGVYTYTLPC
jgi:hypothetical protein